MSTEGQPDKGSGKYLRQQYTQRINRVIDHIEANIDRDLSLASLADIASFSRFHFHRIFHAMTGETVNQFMQRVRVEKAATQLVNNPKKSITEIAHGCGFSSSATFARAFRDTFRMSASEWRAGGYERHRNTRKTASKEDQDQGNIKKDPASFSFYIDSATHNPIWRLEVMDRTATQIEVKDMPELHVVYVRHTGPYQGDPEVFGQLFQKLMTWAGPRGLLRFPETQVLSVYHDDPDVTEQDKLRVSACITVPEGTPVDGEVGEMTIPGGKFAVATFELSADEYGEAWDTVYGKWMPESGYQPDDRLCYELYHYDPENQESQTHIVDICVPVKPL